MLESLSTRSVWHFVVALLIMGVVAAGVSYWAGERYIDSLHGYDPLQKQGGLSSSQDVGKK